MEADGDGRHLAATCQPMEKKIKLFAGEKRERRRGSTLRGEPAAGSASPR